VVGDSLLAFEVPAKDALVSAGRDEVDIVRHDLDFGDFARVLLEVADELPRADLPDPDLSVEAARGQEFEVEAEVEGRDTSFMSVIDGPQNLLVVHSIGSDSSV